MIKRIGQHWKRILLSFILIISFIIIGGYVYLKTSTYEAMSEVTKLLKDESVRVENDVIIIEPDETVGNMVLYQGGLVEMEAYLPLAKEFSEEGYRVFIPYMPFNLAIIDSNAFESIYEEYNSNLPWWIGGHSLGGTSALIYADKHVEQLEGIILLASYPSESVDISDSDLSVLSITASNDQILNQDNFEESKDLLPNNTIYRQIDGGNHSNFGYYGFQEGDGKSDITREEQQQKVVEYFIENIDK